MKELPQLQFIYNSDRYKNIEKLFKIKNIRPKKRIKNTSCKKLFFVDLKKDDVMCKRDTQIINQILVTYR